MLNILSEGICTTERYKVFADARFCQGTGYCRAGSVVPLLCIVRVESLGTTGTLHVGSYEWQLYSISAGVLNSAGTYTGTTM